VKSVAFRSIFFLQNVTAEDNSCKYVKYICV
jgi:hypothetical protein